jgi:hypothetical protein
MIFPFSQFRSLSWAVAGTLNIDAHKRTANAAVILTFIDFAPEPYLLVFRTDDSAAAV